MQKERPTAGIKLYHPPGKKKKEAETHHLSTLSSSFHSFLSFKASTKERREMANEVPGQFEKLDQVSFGWLHVRAILVAGIGYDDQKYN